VRPAALIAGGAGFIGSHIAKRFHRAGYGVTVLDGLLEQTGGRETNLHPIIADIEFVNADIRTVEELPGIVEHSSVVVDCMAWTSHRLALQNPLYDLTLNVESHLCLIHHLHGVEGQKVVYLGSRGQYGNPNVDEVTENTPMIPQDVQGIHKLAAESHYRVYAQLRNLDVVSLRFPNCFGENQMVGEGDIGLVGELIRDILRGREVEVFGAGRKRHLAYAGDVAEVVYQLTQKPLNGFSAFNLAGQQVTIELLVRLLIELTGRGSFRMTALPDEIGKIDIGTARLNDDRLRAYLGSIPASDLRTALSATINYFKGHLE